MSFAIPDRVQKLLSVFLQSPGHTSKDVRRAMLDRAAAHEGAGEVPEDLREYGDQVALDATRVTDDHIADLRAKGRSEDEIFEATLSASLGAGLLRMERGLSALKGSR